MPITPVEAVEIGHDAYELVLLVQARAQVVSTATQALRGL